MTMVNDRYLYLLPPKLGISGLKILDTNMLTEKAHIPPYKLVYKHPTKEKAIVPKWQNVKIVPPRNF